MRCKYNQKKLGARGKGIFLVESLVFRVESLWKV